MDKSMRVKKGRKALPVHERKQMYSFRIDPYLRKQLQFVSKGTGRPMSYLIEVSLKEFLNKIKISE
jgi:predicted DNA-binding protein